MGGFAWVTLATNDSYSLGALILAHSLKQAGTSGQLAVLVTPGVTGPMKDKLAAAFDVVREVNILDSKDEANLRLLKRPELGVTFTKLHCWRLTQYEKCVFLDADTMVLQNCDELFEREELSAAPDVGWPDCFNSGVFVYRPSNETYDKLVQFAVEKGSFDGGDQGLLNLYFSDWAHKDIGKHLPFIYNMCSTACYSYLPAFKQFGGNAKIIHFIGPAKPWLQYFDSETRLVNPSSGMQHLQHILQKWWDLFCEKIHPLLSTAMTGLAGAFAQLTLGAPRSAEQMALEDNLRRQGWEVGNIDYLGRDSFDNIWSKICETISGPTEATPVTPVTPASTPVVVEATTEPSSTASELQSPEQIATEEVITEKVAQQAIEVPQRTDVPKEAAPTQTAASETTRPTEQVVPTAQVLPPTPTSPLGSEVPLVPQTESSPLPVPVTEAASPPPKPEVAPAKFEAEPTQPAECPLPAKAEPAQSAACPLPAKAEPSQPAECALPAKTEPAQPAVCPLPAKIEAEPAQPAVCPVPAKIEAEAAQPAECPLPAKAEPAACPVPAKIEAEPAQPAECPLPAKAEPAPPKVEAQPEPAPTECSLPPKQESAPPPKPKAVEQPVKTTEAPAQEQSLAASVAEAALAEDKEAPVPEVVAQPAPKASEATPKAQEPKAAEPSSPKAESTTPTPPPRKGSGGSKKAPKPKK